MRQVIELFEQHLESLTTLSVERVIESNHGFYNTLPREVLMRAVGAALRAVLADLTQDSSASFAAYLTQVGQQRVQQGAIPSDIMSGFNIGIMVVSDFFKQQFQENPAAIIWWLERIHEISHAAAMALSDTMLTARESLIQAQALVIRELSTPIMPVYKGVLVVPLVGPIDAHRAEQITETVLEGITAHQADILIIDITGVPFIDADVAHYIVQATKAVRLLGAEVFLVGISAEIAQTWIQLDVDLQDITTKANLQVAIAYALQRQAMH